MRFSRQAILAIFHNIVLPVSAFSIPETDNYLAVQVVTERGHGQQYVVEDGDYNLPVESQYAFLIYRSGTENGIDVAKANLNKVDVTTLNFATSYQVQPYDYDEVEKWVKKYTQEVNSMDNFTYTFPRTSKDVTDLHQWNLENADMYAKGFGRPSD